MSGSIAIPTTEADRVARVPIPKDVDGNPAYDRENLRAVKRAEMKKAHEAKVHEALLRRASILQRADGSESFRRQVRALVERDIVEFFNLMVWTENPQLQEPEIPFVLYPFQEDLSRYYQDTFTKTPNGIRSTWMIEKSRKQGFSWWAIGTRLHSWLFRNGWTIFLGAVLVTDIDDGGQAASTFSHLGRARFILQHLPEWLRPQGLEKEKHNKTLFLRNPDRPTNIIAGKQYSPIIARGGRASEFLGDEGAHSKQLDSAMRSIFQVSNRICLGSTPLGRDNAWGRMRFGGERKKVTTWLWPQNPCVSTEEYWTDVADMGPEKAASELDISYDLSASNRIFTEFSSDRNVKATVAYDKNLPIHLAIDPGIDDPCALIWIQPSRLDKTYRIIDFIQFTGKPGDWYVPFMLGFVPARTVHGREWPYTYEPAEMAIIRRHGDWHPIEEAYGDAYGAGRNLQTGTSLYELWEEYGVAKAGGIMSVKNGNKEEAVRIAEIAIPRTLIASNIAEQRTQFHDFPTITECFYQYAWVDRDNEDGRAMKRQPKHNIYSHAMDAWQFYLVGKGDDVVGADEMPVHPSGRGPADTVYDSRHGILVPDFTRKQDPIRMGPYIQTRRR